MALPEGLIAQHQQDWQACGRGQREFGVDIFDLEIQDQTLYLPPARDFRNGFVAAI